MAGHPQLWAEALGAEVMDTFSRPLPGAGSMCEYVIMSSYTAVYLFISVLTRVGVTESCMALHECPLGQIVHLNNFVNGFAHVLTR